MSKLRASTFCCAFSSALLIQRMDDRLVFLEPEPLQHGVELVGPEDAHQIVFQRQEELGVTRVALTAGAAAQLVVDAAALVPLGAEHEQPAGLERLILQPRDLPLDLDHPQIAIAVSSQCRQLLADAHVGIAAELDVGAAARHVGGDGDGAGHAGLGDDVRFLLVVAGVEDGEHLDLARRRRRRCRAPQRRWGRRSRAAPSRADAAAPRAARTSRSRWCRPTPAGPCLQSSISVRIERYFSAPCDRPRRRRRCRTIGMVGGNLHHFEIVDVEELVGLGEAVPVMPASFSYMRK